MDAVVWGFIGTIVGALSSIGTTWISSFHAVSLQKQAVLLERLEHGRAFQRQNLLEIQEALHDSLRMVARAHMEDLASHAKGCEWGKSLLSEEVNEGIRVTGRKLAILIERVADDTLRDDLKAAASASSAVLRLGSRAGAERAFSTTGDTANHAMEHLGRVLRTLY